MPQNHPAPGCLKLIPDHNYQEIGRPRPNVGIHRCVDCGKTITLEVVPIYPEGK